MAKAKKLPSGNWRCLVRKKIDGKQVAKSFTTSTKKEAEYLAAEWVVNENENLISDITLREAFERYIAAKEGSLSPSTIKGYDIILRHRLKSIMPRKIKTLTTEQIQAAISEEAKLHSPKTVKNASGLLSAVLKMFRKNFSYEVTLPQKEKVKMYIPTDKDVSRLLETCRGKPLEVAILLAAFGPMRRGEVSAVTSDDVVGNIIIVNKAWVKDKHNKWILKDPKNYTSSREIPYPDFVIERIKDIKGNLVPYTAESITSRFCEHLKKHGLPHFRYHDLRHYCVSICKAMNIPDEYIMARGGWATNYTMNNVYSHTLPDVQDAVTVKILNHFSTVNEHENEHE